MQGNPIVHPFDEWFSRVYPSATPDTRASALVAWNAAVHAVDEVVSIQKDQFVFDSHYEYAAVVRDLRELVVRVARTADK